MAESRGKVYGCLVVLLLLFLAGGGAGWYFVLHNKGLNRDFDAESIARSETNMWRAYYGGRGAELAFEMVSVLREQMGVSLLTAKAVVEPMARGAMAFHAQREGYGQTVLPLLEESYAALAEAVGEDWDPRKMAEAELAWWVARRTPGEDSPEQVGAKIAELYALMYGATNGHIQRAGLLRAQAAALRDAGGKDADWRQVESLLLESYTALLEGVRGNR